MATKPSRITALSQDHGTRLLRLLVLICSVMLSSLQAQTRNRALPDDNLAYPVLIGIGNGTGSGFFANLKSAIYLVTAKHVLFDQNTRALVAPVFTLTSYSKDLSDMTANSFTIDTVKLGMVNIVAHPSEDVVVVKISVDDP